MHRNALRPLDLAAVFASNKAIFGDFRMEVEDPPVDPPVPTPPGRGPGSDGNKHIAEMSPEEKVDYFAKKADRLAGILKDFDGLTVDELTELRDKASRHDALEQELMSDKDKAIAEARKAGETETRSGLLPKLVNAEFRAAAAGKVAADKLAAALEFADTSKFVKDGEVDAEKVAKFIESLAPAQEQQRKGPSSFGMGSRTPAGGAPGDQGRAQAERRFGKQSA